MALYNENLRNYILDVVNKFDLHARCAELSAIFARSNIRDLQDVFPTVVHSIFGFSASSGVPGVGWGLRTSVQNSMNPAFDLLNDFLHPTGPMLLLCYRLLHDSIKFEFDFNLLPHKVAESIRSGHCAQFYSDLVNVDPIRRHITSLSLNAFDYYMLHFIIHGTLPLHKVHPFALCVHNECSKTAYFFLCAEYLCNFLPSAPDSVVLPTNVCATVKAPQPTMPTLQPLQPQRSPKYLKIPNLNMYGNNNAITSSPPTTNSATTIESPRTYAWRSESVLNFFIDIWLRFDVEEVRDLPGSEFIRVVRLLVKQAHSFANSAPLDHTAMSQLRKQARPMMRLRIYAFLKSIIDRWPLDGSLIVVLELWLSYIQPWRYRFELQRHGCNLSDSISLQGFEDFISDNLIIYTQIFSFVMARFERLDFALLSNASMLFRVVKVFSQKYLAPQLAQAEATYLGNYARNIDSPQRRLGQYGRTNQTFNDSAWDSNRFYQDDAYIPLFGTSMQVEVERFLRALQISKRYVQQEIQMIRDHMHQERTRLGYVKRFVNLFVNEVSPMNEKLQKMIDIPELIKASMRGLSLIFNIDLQTIVMDNYETNVEQNNLRTSNISSFSDTSSGYLNMSTISPIKMRHNVSNIRASIDPAVYPIQSHECEFLIRFLHHLSSKLNEMFGQEMQQFYHRDDIWGRLAQQILYEPMTAQWFDKPRGIKELCEEQLPARLILRPLGSYKFIATLCFSILLGYLLWGSITCGVLLLIMGFLFYILIKALI